MPLRAHAVDPITRRLDPELSAPIDPGWLQAFFAHPRISEARFPLLWRLREQDSDSHFASAELQGVVAEMEEGLMLLSPNVGDPFGRFYGTFHTLCMIALLAKQDVEVCVE